MAFNDCVLQIEVETVLPVVPMEGSYCIDTFQSKFEIFLLHLHQDYHLSLSAVKGYKAMLNSVFCLKEFDLSTDQVLQVIHTCDQWVYRTTPGVPSWNMDVVLLHFIGAPFKLLHQSSFRFFTQKTLSWWLWKQPKELGNYKRCLLMLPARVTSGFFPTFWTLTNQSLGSCVNKSFGCHLLG